jgi:hypothetical protein
VKSSQNFTTPCGGYTMIPCRFREILALYVFLWI